MSDVIDRLNAALEGRYRIERELGEGGMATVFLAEDVRHKRQVALKVLKPELAAVVGAERFLTEIETTANLTHPNILPLFDSGEADGFLFYVMPYIEGESLRDRLDAERQLPVDEAVRIAREVADALDYAHRHGVVHRDVKPANVLLHEGRPMVADFGIALAVSTAGGGRITETGLSLGTPHYMSPEQASGDRDVDPRTDVYALGCVLYEMLAGEPPYGGPTAQSVLARILTEEPRRVTDIRRTVPRHIDAVVTKSLEKLPADRFDSAAAFRSALDDEGFRHERGAAPGASRPEPSRADGRTTLSRTTAALAVLLLAAVILAVWGWLRAPEPPPVSRLEVNVEPPVALNWGPAFAVSPDGSGFIYRGPGGQLFMRSMASLDPQPIPLTEEARTPAFSPDGGSVVYHVGSPGDDGLRTFSLSGSTPVELMEGAAPAPAWGGDGFIYFKNDGSYRAPEGIWRMPESGGELEPVLEDDSTTSYWFPETLPGSRGLLVTATGSSPAVAVLDFDSGEVTTLVAGSHPRFAGGRLFWLNPEFTLMSAPFDPRALAITGPPAPVTAGVLNGVFGTGQYDVSENGTLIYQEGFGETGETVVWVDRQGGEEPVAPDGWPELADDVDHVTLSPDGTQLALVLQGESGAGAQHVWTYSLRQGTLNRLTVEGSWNHVPRWMPDGRTLAFSSDRNGVRELFAVPFDASDRPRPLVALAGAQLYNVTWHPDGERFLVAADSLAAADSGGDVDILRGQLGQDSLVPFVATSFREVAPRLSPDGRWAAYVSNQSGQDEVYIRAFPEGGRVWTVSRGGGSRPLWSPSGSELFYLSAGRLMAVSVSTDDGLALGDRRVLFETGPYETGGVNAAFDVAADGQRFVFIRDPGGEAVRMVVVQGLFREIEGGGR